jgi:hypothetical protein
MMDVLLLLFIIPTGETGDGTRLSKRNFSNSTLYLYSLQTSYKSTNTPKNKKYRKEEIIRNSKKKIQIQNCDKVKKNKQINESMGLHTSNQTSLYSVSFF